MTKYGRRLSFGIAPLVEAAKPRRVVQVAQSRLIAKQQG